MPIKIDDGGMAFPCEQSQNVDGNWNGTFEPGMTLLDYFAAKAMQSLLEGYLTNESNLENVISTAWVVADKMIEAKAAFLKVKSMP